MSSKKQHPLLNDSERSSANSIYHRKYNLVSRDSKFYDSDQAQNVPSRQQIQQQLLRAFDTQMSFGQKPLPKGLSSRHKQKVRSVSLNSASLRKPEAVRPSLHAQQLKHISERQVSHINSSHHTQRSRSSQVSSVRPFHHNKRQSITSQFLIKKQTQKLVQKLLCVKPSQQVSHQKHIQSYNKHVVSKNIMMHRFSNPNEKKGIIVVKRSNFGSQHSTIVLKDIHARKNEELRTKKLNAIQLKEIQLRKMLMEEKKKTRMQTLKKLPPSQNVSIPIRKNHQRFKTLDPRLLINRMPQTSSSQQYSSHLPKIRTFSKAQSYQGRDTFGVSTPGANSYDNSRTPGHIKRRLKTYF